MSIKPTFWADLPKDLLHRVIAHLHDGALSDLRTWAAIQSACKAWHVATADYPLSAVAVTSLRQLDSLCRALPNLQDLSTPEGITSDGAVEDLTPLLQCTQLTALQISGRDNPIDWSQYSGGYPKILISQVPAALESLRLRSVDLVRDPLKTSDHSSFSRLGSLRWEDMKSSLAQLCHILMWASNLRVSILISLQ